MKNVSVFLKSMLKNFGLKFVDWNYSFVHTHMHLKKRILY